MDVKIIKIGLLTGVVFLLGGCGNHFSDNRKKEETINPFNPSSMVDTYNKSKNKINEATQKENDKIDKALKDNGLQ